MGDTLRSIGEGMRCDYSYYESLRYDSTGFWEHDPTKCPKCRLKSLLAEYEKVDLVKLVLQHEVKMSGASDGEFFVSCQCGRVFTSWSTESPDAHGKWSKHRADELETWLAVNLERIKTAAIQSAVDEERLENRKLFSIGMSDLRREPNYERICDKVSQIDEAIRARAQAKENP